MFEGNPREKLLERGVSSLTNAELIEILINTGVRNATASEIANLVLKRSNGTLSGLVRLNVHDLAQINGIGLFRAIMIVSIFELGRRKYQEEIPFCEPIKQSSQIYELFRDLSDLNHETLWVLFLRKNNTLISKKQMSEGGIDGTVVDVKMILKEAINFRASSIVLVHNHPSGTCGPSELDVRITRKLKEASKLFDICLIDHVIIGAGKYFSFSDNGMLG